MAKLTKTLVLATLLLLGHGTASGQPLGFRLLPEQFTVIIGNSNSATTNSSISSKSSPLTEPATTIANTARSPANQTKTAPASSINSPNSFDREVEIERLRQLENATDGSRDVLKAFRGYAAVAKKGNLQGYIEVGRLLVDLNNPAADVDAYEQFSIAARKGYSEGIAWQAWMHESKRAPNASSRAALNLYNSAAQKGNAWAMYKLGVTYETAGLGVHRDMGVAIDWYWKAARLYFGPAVVQLALLFDTGDESYRDKAKAFKLFELGARLNQPTALFYLGLKYANGDEVANDFSLAAKYYERAANLGNYASQNNLGNLYLDGKGVAPNPETAVSWFRKAALQGDNMAASNLGYCYKNGIGVSKNLETAAYWYRRSADTGYEKAQFLLGSMYQFGEGVTKNVETAVIWYKKSAEHNYPDAIYQLAFLYSNGNGVKQDFVEAAKWLRLGVKLGNAAAMNDLAAFIAQKKIEPQLGEDILDLFMRAANAGDPTGMVNYGRKLEFGLGVGVDIQQAITLLEKGRNAKVLDANILLADIYIHPPKDVNQDLNKAFQYLFDAAPESDEAARAITQLAFTNPELFNAKDRERIVEFLERVAKSGNTENSESAKIVLGYMLMLEQWKLNKPILVLSWLYDLSDSGNTDATALLLMSYLKENKDNPAILNSIFGSDKGAALLTKISRQPGLFKSFAEILLELNRAGFEKVNSNYFYQMVERSAVAGDSTMAAIWAEHLSESSPEKAAELLRTQISSGSDIAKGYLCNLLKTYRVLPVNAGELRACF